LSYSVPGPERLARQTANPITEARDELERFAPKRPPNTGPPDLDLLVTHEQARSAARRENNATAADRALTEVVDDVQGMLEFVAEELRSSGRGRSRQQVKDGVKRLVRTSRLSTLPLRDMADLFNLPPDSVDTVVTALTRDGGISPAERLDALKGIDHLREQLRQVEASHDHELLDRLLRFIVEIVVLVPLSAVGRGDLVIKDVVKAATIALVALTLRNIATISLERNDAQQLWALIDEIEAAIGKRSPELSGLQSKLQLLTSPSN
jgi:hypothetical protein